MKQTNSNILIAVIALLCVYNACYWPAKFWHVLPGFYKGILAHWKLITFLEFLAVGAIGVDMILRWDKFTYAGKRVRLAFSGLLFVLFAARLIFGIMDIYIKGAVR